MQVFQKMKAHDPSFPLCVSALPATDIIEQRAHREVRQVCAERGGCSVTREEEGTSYSGVIEAHEEAVSEAPQETMEVNPEYLKQLKDLDIPEEEAKKALILTGNISAEEAAMFYFESLENHNMYADEDEMCYKMVFLVNMELPMGIGKVASQVGHAAIGLYQLLLKDSKTKKMANKWDASGAKKIVLQGVSSAHLMQLQALAISLDLPTYLVQDAGRTQIAAGSHTVLGIMGEEEKVNKVTGKLKLLN